MFELRGRRGQGIFGLIRDGVEWREVGRNTWVESEACARIFEPCCSYMSVGVSFSPALLKMAKLSAPGLRFDSRGSQACVAWPTCVLILEVGERLMIYWGVSLALAGQELAELEEVQTTKLQSL